MKSLFEYYKIIERKFSTAQRRELADKGMALPDGSFPIENKEDLKNAIRAYGRAKDKDRAKAWVIKRAKEMGKVNLLPASWNVNESINEGKKYAKPPKIKETVEEENYPEALEDVIDNLELEIESYFDDHDEVMTSTINDYIIEAIKSKINEESFDDWDKNYNHEVIRDVLDNTKENKRTIVETAIESLFSAESRILDDIKEDLDIAKERQNEYKSEKSKRREESLTETDFDPDEEEIEDDEEGTTIITSIESLEAKLDKTNYIREYKKLFDKHFKQVSSKIKKISR